MEKMENFEGEVDFVAEEESIDIPIAEKTTASPEKNPQELPKVTAEKIKNACESIRNDNCLPPELRELVDQLKSADLEEKLLFLNDCLVPRGKFRNAAKEKAWARYYAAFSTQHSGITEVTASPAATAWIALKLFQLLVSEAYGEKTSESVSALEIRADEKDIVKYVGGCVVKKLKQRVWRLKKSAYRNEKLLCLDALTCAPELYCEDSVTPPDMTSMLNRGGLTFIKPNVLQMFMSMEQMFRETCTSTGATETQAKSDVFIEKCMNSDAVSVCFYDTLYSFDLSQAVQEDTLQNVLHLFFKIRIHHKLKTMMDKMKCTWKEKSLRKKLKTFNVENSQEGSL